MRHDHAVTGGPRSGGRGHWHRRNRPGACPPDQDRGRADAGPRLGSFAALAGRLRGAVAAHIPKPDRRAFWRWAFADAPGSCTRPDRNAPPPIC
ncbi:hypothetical protein ACFQFQ_24310 [Sulfitobacter porphyrae]|uniref:Sirohaem synthase dimerisation domain-containing protein n=1 Tax=Sulfitobacter porphyrae TaxID=1246864 RepID=A0ABW2B8R5_9RHOB